MLDFINMIVPVAFLTAGMVLGSMEYLHMLQLESYQLDGLKRWVDANQNRAYVKGFVVAIVCLLSMAVLTFFAGVWTYLLTSVLLFLGGLVSFLLYKRVPAKKKLVFTKRVMRLLAIHTAFYAILFVIVDVVGDYVVQVRALPFVLPAVWVWTIACSARIAQPVENRINRGFFRDAQRILSQNDKLIRIGITGSYGKTSTKFILGTLLKEKYNTLITPSSFNTPMGITRVVREQLKPEHEVFIAEMGARHKGDIKELVELVHPSVGVLTSVGPQHLETFGTIDVVAETKYELIAGLPDDGAAFFAADGGWCEMLYKKCGLKDKALAGLDAACPVHAREIAVSNEGSSFTLVTEQGEIRCTTPLLGRHNIQNAVLCAAVALHLGLTLEQIQAGMSKLEPVEHRLQLIRGQGGVTVIDDAFNANPAGAQAAMEVLSGFKGRRICVTPGMVELGAEEEMRNREFGRQMAKACDIAVLIGIKRTEPIYQGLLDEGFEADNVLRVNTLAEATEFINKVSRAGDVILFENDLPDNYNE